MVIRCHQSDFYEIDNSKELRITQLLELKLLVLFILNSFSFGKNMFILAQKLAKKFILRIFVVDKYY